jgi:hypothetical protein
MCNTDIMQPIRHTHMMQLERHTYMMAHDVMYSLELRVSCFVYFASEVAREEEGRQSGGRVEGREGGRER